MCTCVTNKKNEYAKSLQIANIHPTIGSTASSLSVKNTSFYFSRDSKYLLVMLLMGPRHALWSQARRSPGRMSFHISLVLERTAAQMDAQQITVSQHSPISLWSVSIFAASHSESFLMILYSLGRLDSAFFFSNSYIFHLRPCGSQI